LLCPSHALKGERVFPLSEPPESLLLSSPLLFIPLKLRSPYKGSEKPFLGNIKNPAQSNEEAGSVVSIV